MSPQPSAAVPQTSSESTEYSPEERATLLGLAHQAIEAQLANLEVNVSPPTSHLAEKRGAFTSLYRNGELRGCVGYVFPLYSVYRTVAETAVAAAFHDIRFPSVTAEDVPLLTVEISVLSRLMPIAPEEIEVGRHGLVITYGSRRGLLLPQVPVEHGWDRLTFLEQTCLKSGSPAEAWQRGALIEAFTAEVFGEF